MGFWTGVNVSASTWWSLHVGGLVPTASALGRPGGHPTHGGWGAQAGASTSLPGSSVSALSCVKLFGESKSMLKSMRPISRSSHVPELR